MLATGSLESGLWAEKAMSAIERRKKPCGKQECKKVIRHRGWFNRACDFGELNWNSRIFRSLATLLDGFPLISRGTMGCNPLRSECAMRSALAGSRD